MIIGAAVLFAGELTPKILGVHHAECLAPRLIGPLTFLVRLCSPAVWVMERFCERLKTQTVQKAQSEQIMDIITLEHITGYVRVRELFMQNSTNPDPSDWKQLIRPVLHISEKASLTQLLTLFLEKQEIACLVDNEGGLITGWITMDDVMQVLMGARV